MESRRDEREKKDMAEEVEKVELEEVEENIYFPSHYSPSGCPTVPLAFSGMTGRQHDNHHHHHQSHHSHWQDISQAGQPDVHLRQPGGSPLEAWL